jgi:hypothetical protein
LRAGAGKCAQIAPENRRVIKKEMAAAASPAQQLDVHMCEARGECAAAAAAAAAGRRSLWGARSRCARSRAAHLRAFGCAANGRDAQTA